MLLASSNFLVPNATFIVELVAFLCGQALKQPPLGLHVLRGNLIDQLTTVRSESDEHAPAVAGVWGALDQTAALESV